LFFDNLIIGAIMLSNYEYANAHKADIDISSDCEFESLRNFLLKYELEAHIDWSNGAHVDYIEIIAKNKFQLIAALADHHQTKIDDEWLLTQIK
tara:strand:- start:307 stop:588 length:282 start_codon:yes stop_codon:yes gene_type:complete